MAQEWHYTKDGEKHGPITTNQLKELAASGHLDSDRLVLNSKVPSSKINEKIEQYVKEFLPFVGFTRHFADILDSDFLPGP